jgi:hypothetical protein
MSIFQWVLLFAILAFAFWHNYRARRITLFSLIFTWFSLPLCMFIFSTYATSLSTPERDEWVNYFPNGLHVFAMSIFGWFYGVFTGVLAVGIGRVLRREPLFRFLKSESHNDKVDA